MEGVFEQIAELIQIELLKRGFIVDVVCSQTGENCFKVKTTSFQTYPVLFKNICIKSSSAIFRENTNEKGNKYTDYFVRLFARYELFDGGTNGCELFTIEFRIFENWDKVRILSIK